MSAADDNLENETGPDVDRVGELSELPTLVERYVGCSYRISDSETVADYLRDPFVAGEAAYRIELALAVGGSAFERYAKNDPMTPSEAAGPTGIDVHWIREQIVLGRLAAYQHRGRVWLWPWDLNEVTPPVFGRWVWSYHDLDWVPRDYAG